MLKLTKLEQKILALIIDGGELALGDFKSDEGYKKIATACRNLYKKGVISQKIELGYTGNAPYKLVSYIPNMFSSIYDRRFYQ